MPTISVICAPPPGANPGMASVDLAFHALCARHGIDAQVHHCLLYDLHEAMSHQPADAVDRLIEAQRLPFNYKCFRDRLDEIYASDAVVFWGDFLHARNYVHAMVKKLVSLGVADTPERAEAVVYEHLFLSGAPGPVLGRTLVYGETTLFNQPSDYINTEYGRQLERFVRGCRRVWMRELYSAMNVSRLRGDYRQANLGTDCSLLLRPEDLRGLARTAWSLDNPGNTGKVGVFFGRSAVDGKALGRFAREVCRKLDKPAQWLPWGDASAFDDRFERVRRGFGKLEVRRREAAPLVGDLYALLAGYDLVISDTYHVCVNAWRMGVPAVCVAEAVSKIADSVSSGRAYAWRDKRQVFFSMYDAMPYFVYAEEVLDRTWRDRRVWQLSQLLADRAVAQHVVSRIHDHRDRCEADLVNELKGVLASGRASLDV